MLLSFLFICITLSKVHANNLSVSNVTLEDRNPSSKTVVVQFDVSWENSWKTKINHDATWLTVRLYDPTVNPTSKMLCDIAVSGVNPTGISAGTSSDLEVYVPSDQKGAFLRPMTYGKKTSSSTTAVQLMVDYESCGFEESSSVAASVFGIEMVFIPEGSYFTGDDNAAEASLIQGASDSDAWYIEDESSINVTNAQADGYYYVSAGNAGEDSSGSSFTIPSTFPKGYGSFYAMKYELNEGQWQEFFNSLPSAEARANRDITNAAHKNTDSVKARNTLACSGLTLVCTSNRSNRALNYISWNDLVAFLDWAALRPMTELEYEKMSRGPLLPVSGEFAWGATSLTGVSALSDGDEDGSETVLTTGANVHFNDIVLSGGDSVNGVEYAQGPLRNGIFANSSSNRMLAGSGYYGVLELSGNVNEQVVTIGNSAGRLFNGTHGDGNLTTVSGFEGNANQADWPGIDIITSRGVTGSDGSGDRGGSWDDQSSGARLMISDRKDAAKNASSASSNSGGRGVRTYDGN